MKKNSSLVTIGISSLFLIFSVLCLVILSLLSLGTSRSDLSMSKETMTQTTSYYEACSTASELCLEAEKFLTEIYLDSTTKSEYYEKINTFSHKEFTWDSQNRQLSMEIPFTDSQSLIVCLSVCYPESDQDPLLKTDIWRTTVTGTWTPDNRQRIYQGD